MKNNNNSIKITRTNETNGLMRLSLFIIWLILCMFIIIIMILSYIFNVKYNQTMIWFYKTAHIQSSVSYPRIYWNFYILVSRYRKSPQNKKERKWNTLVGDCGNSRCGIPPHFGSSPTSHFLFFVAHEGFPKKRSLLGITNLTKRSKGISTVKT